MPFYVYSTLAASQEYATYKEKKYDNDLHEIEKKILIHGGTNVADKQFVTPKGVVTEVSDVEFAILEKNPVFNMHKENGFITVESKEYKPEKIANDMNLNDPSSPKTPEDYKNKKDGPKPESLNKDKK